MNPAAGFFFPRGWNVLLDKLNAMLSAPATQQAVSQMDGAAVDPRVTAFYKLRDIAERDEDIESANIIQSAIAELGAVRESAATTASARDWTEDYADGENQYQCKCSTCGHSFFGHKRRVTCKVCAAVTTACASRHADWCIGGEKGPCNCRAQAPSREAASPDLIAAINALPVVRHLSGDEMLYREHVLAALAHQGASHASNAGEDTERVEHIEAWLQVEQLRLRNRQAGA